MNNDSFLGVTAFTGKLFSEITARAGSVLSTGQARAFVMVVFTLLPISVRAEKEHGYLSATSLPPTGEGVSLLPLLTGIILILLVIVVRGAVTIKACKPKSKINARRSARQKKTSLSQNVPPAWHIRRSGIFFPTCPMS
ncbi:hypothetical protein [Grimontia sedimenti]|uniref:hypothetical protein n=1 Tax=Grimontia sedimenti TaxID=2711294 RepID=UPI001F1AB32A|nr:hypothetical protein [Grimontia sedimenti]